MKVIITGNTAIRGKSIAADPEKVVGLKDEDARALITAGKAYVPTKEDVARMSAKGGKKKTPAEKEAAEKAAAEKEAAEKESAKKAAAGN